MPSWAGKSAYHFVLFNHKNHYLRTPAVTFFEFTFFPNTMKLYSSFSFFLPSSHHRALSSLFFFSVRYFLFYIQERFFFPSCSATLHFVSCFLLITQKALFRHFLIITHLVGEPLKRSSRLLQWESWSFLTFFHRGKIITTWKLAFFLLPEFFFLRIGEIKDTKEVQKIGLSNFVEDKMAGSRSKHTN